jgi:hypothetical protein
VVLLWRNLGNSTLYFSMPDNINYPFLLALRRGDELIKPVVAPVANREIVSAGAQGIQPHSQYRFVLRLDRIYQLDRPGNYELFAERLIPDGKYWDPPITNSPPVLMRSGVLKFTLLPSK